MLVKREIELQIVCGIRTFTLDGEEYAHLGDLAKFLENREKIRQTYTITAIGKPYGFSAYKLNQYLINKHIQYRKRNVCHIYQKYAKKGYVKSVSGANKKTHMYWTAYGKDFIEKLLAEDGYTKTS